MVLRVADSPVIPVVHFDISCAAGVFERFNIPSRSLSQLNDTTVSTESPDALVRNSRVLLNAMPARRPMPRNPASLPRSFREAPTAIKVSTGHPLRES